MTVVEKLFALIRLGLGCGNDADAGVTISAEEWPLLYSLANKQAMIGICLAGVQKLPRDVCPDTAQLLNWIGTAELIRRRNRVLNKRCVDLTLQLKSVGIDCCVLKGQGVARLYPDPLLRQSGDIDLWCKLCGSEGIIKVDSNIAEMKKRLLALKEGRVGKMVYHHVEWSLPDVEVEIHYRPQAFNNPFVNWRFQQWCNKLWNDRQWRECFYIPSVAFDLVYLLAHLYHHLLFEGVGLRQVCDYYLLLCRDDVPVKEREEAARTICSLQMMHFARGLMWVLGEVFHLAREKMIVQPGAKEGRFILAELLQAGNSGAGNNLHHRSVADTFIQRTKYRARFLTHYPSEIIWDIPFRLYHWCWRRKSGSVVDAGG